MNLILRQVIGYQQGLKKTATSASPLLKKQLENTQKDLNSILNKWKFGDTPIKTSTEFLAQFEPWINKQLELQKEWKVFLAKKGVSSLAELADLPTEESEQLKFFKENIKIKEEIIDEYKEQEQTWTTTQTNLLNQIEDLEFKLTEASHQEGLAQLREEITEAQQKHEQELAEAEETFKNTEEDYLKRIEELRNEVTEIKATKTAELSEEQKEKLAEYDDLITERDEAIREKRTLEQSVLALNNRLTLKQQEVANKEKSLEKLKKEKGELDKNLNKKLTEKNSLITTLNQEISEHKKKYTKQGKLLDTEQLECKKLEEKVEELERKLTQSEDERRKLLEDRK